MGSSVYDHTIDGVDWGMGGKGGEEGEGGIV